MGVDCCSPGGAAVFSGVKVTPYFGYTATPNNSFVQWNNNDTDFYDTDHYFSTTDRTKLTAPFHGRYMVSGILEFLSSAGGLIVTAMPSSGYSNNRSITPATLAGVNVVSVPILMTITLVAGDYIQVQVNNMNAFNVAMSANFAISMYLLGKL